MDGPQVERAVHAHVERLLPGDDDEPLNCCEAENLSQAEQMVCLPIRVPADDPTFRQAFDLIWHHAL